MAQTANSSQRGGAANIGSPRVKAQKGPPHDQDVVPEPAIRSSTPENFHTGVSTSALPIPLIPLAKRRHSKKIQTGI